MNVNTRHYGQKLHRKQFELSMQGRHRLPFAWYTLLREPLNLYRVYRISEHQGVAIVRHFNMRQHLRVNLNTRDMAMLEAAQGITLAVGQSWQPDNKYGYIDCEVRQFFAAGSYHGHFNGLRWVEPAQQQSTAIVVYGMFLSPTQQRITALLDKLGRDPLVYPHTTDKEKANAVYYLLIAEAATAPHKKREALGHAEYHLSEIEADETKESAA